MWGLDTEYTVAMRHQPDELLLTTNWGFCLSLSM